MNDSGPIQEENTLAAHVTVGCRGALATSVNVRAFRGAFVTIWCGPKG